MSETSTLGRPSTYTQATAEAILDLYATGLSLRDISLRDGMPGLRTIFDWRHAHDAFRTALTRTREAKAESLVEEGLAAVDAPLDLTMDGKVASAGVSRQLNRSNYRLAMAKALDRATWGDALKVDGSLTIGAMIAFSDIAARPAPAMTVDADAIVRPSVPDTIAEDDAK